MAQPRRKLTSGVESAMDPHTGHFIGCLSSELKANNNSRKCVIAQRGTMMTWTKEMDVVITRGLKAGLSRQRIADELGVTRAAVISRSHRLLKRIFPSDMGRQKELREQARERLSRIARRNAKAIAEMERLMRRGVPRADAMRAALAQGATLAVIGNHFGVSRQAVYQYCSGHP